MRQDLQFGLRPNDDAERLRENCVMAGNLSHVFWEYYIDFYQQLKAKFRRRYFQLVGLNEYNQFWCLSCFIRPLYATLTMNQPEMLAKNVARIGTQQGIPSTGFHPHTTQVSSPALVLFRKYGSPLEHAILLCDLFLGIGLNSFVCIGTLHSERSAWVITFNNMPLYHAHNPTNVEQENFTDNNVDTAMFRTLSRSRSTKTANRSQTTNSSSLARSSSGRHVPLKISEIIISPPASDDESDDGGYDDAIAFAKQNLTRKVETTTVDHAVGQDVFSLIENVSKKKYVPKKNVKTVVADHHASMAQKNEKTAKTKSTAITMLKKVLVDEKETMQQVLYSSRNSEVATSELQFDSKIPLSLDPNKKVSLWDATTGQCYSISNESNLPPINVGCLFNNRNVWVNLQKYELISCLKWDLDRIHDWFPFLDEEVKETCGPIQCWYSEPTQLSEILQEDSDATPNFVQELCTSLQQYRNDTIGISESPFFSPICKILQEATTKCEAQLQSQSYQLVNSDQHENQPNHQKLLNNVLAWAESEILAVLPDHHSWVGKPYHFYHSNLDEIMHQLVWTGILDCTVPQALYAVGAQIFDYPWGLKSVWVYIGYCTDLFHGTKD
eukprot:Phypoly_transcript_00899.p1 GENE.Phypoly_transcript_00899~~Phypoly_transcript_00899.p1  ORF type:complete len:611 (+),score=61.71 Phypoly_transcript_00899:2035-3867(+)